MLSGCDQFVGLDAKETSYPDFWQVKPNQQDRNNLNSANTNQGQTSGTVDWWSRVLDFWTKDLEVGKADIGNTLHLTDLQFLKHWKFSPDTEHSRREWIQAPLEKKKVLQSTISSKCSEVIQLWALPCFLIYNPLWCQCIETTISFWDLLLL